MEWIIQTIHINLTQVKNERSDFVIQTSEEGEQFWDKVSKFGRVFYYFPTSKIVAVSLDIQTTASIGWI